MNIEEYINDGILELYVCGALSEREMCEVTSMAKKHPEVKKEIALIEKTMLSFSAHQMQPLSTELKKNIFNQIKETSVPEAKTIVIKIVTWWRTVAAALLLFGTSLVLIFYYYNSLQKIKNELYVLETEKDKIAQKSEFIQINYREIKQHFKSIRTPGTKVILLEKQNVSSQAQAQVYWNPSTQTVFVDGNALPPPFENKVYQLWALSKDNDTPKSLGILSGFEAGKDNFFRLDDVQFAEAFAITLESKGGSIKPNLNFIYVMGEVKT